MPLLPSSILSAHLWDLRAQAEAKLRCLTRLQQMVEVYESESSPAERTRLHRDIVTDLTDIVTISKSLRQTADEAFTAAEKLPGQALLPTAGRPPLST